MSGQQNPGPFNSANTLNLNIFNNNLYCGSISLNQPNPQTQNYFSNINSNPSQSLPNLYNLLQSNQTGITLQQQQQHQQQILQHQLYMQQLQQQQQKHSLNQIFYQQQQQQQQQQLQGQYPFAKQNKFPYNKRYGYQNNMNFNTASNPLAANLNNSNASVFAKASTPYQSLSSNSSLASMQSAGSNQSKTHENSTVEAGAQANEAETSAGEKGGYTYKDNRTRSIYSKINSNSLVLMHLKDRAGLRISFQETKQRRHRGRTSSSKGTPPSLIDFPPLVTKELTRKEVTITTRRAG